MNDYTTTAQEIIDTVDLDGLTSADLAVHLEIDYDHMNDVEDGIRVKNEDGIIRCWGIERDEQGHTLGYSYADYEQVVDIDYNIGQDGGPLNNLEDLARALRELADFAK